MTSPASTRRKIFTFSAHPAISFYFYSSIYKYVIWPTESPGVGAQTMGANRRHTGMVQIVTTRMFQEASLHLKLPGYEEMLGVAYCPVTSRFAISPRGCYETQSCLDSWWWINRDLVWRGKIKEAVSISFSRRWRWKKPRVHGHGWLTPVTP